MAVPHMQLSEEDASAKAAWLAKLDAPQWGADAITQPPEQTGHAEDDVTAAKRAWLAKLDASDEVLSDGLQWKHLASAVETLAGEAATLAVLEADCLAGDDVACATVSNEDEAKRAWLSRLDVPSWGTAASAVAQVAASADTSEEVAKREWLLKLDAPTWDQAAVVVATVAEEATTLAAIEEDCAAGIDVACDTLSKEDAAKRAWLSRLDAPSLDAAAMAVGEVAADAKSSEEEAKRAWLSRLDAPTWSKAARALNAVATQAAASAVSAAECVAGDDVACGTVSNEDGAKRQFMASLEAPQWGEAASAVAEVSAAPPASEEDARRAWLVRLDAATWSKAARALEAVAVEAATFQQMEGDCAAGDDVACDVLGREEGAKRAWMAKVDVPQMDAAASAVTEVAAGVVAAPVPGRSALQAASAAATKPQTLRDGLLSLRFLLERGQLSELDYQLKKAFLLRELALYGHDTASAVLEQVLRSEPAEKPTKLRHALVSLRYLRDNGEISAEEHDSKRAFLLRELAFKAGAGLDSPPSSVSRVAQQAQSGRDALLRLRQMRDSGQISLQSYEEERANLLRELACYGRVPPIT